MSAKLLGRQELVLAAWGGEFVRALGRAQNCDRTVEALRLIIDGEFHPADTSR